MPPNTPTLSYFTRLAPGAYYLPRAASAPVPSAPGSAPSPSTIPPPASTPLPALSTPASPAPRLVVLATWMGAQPPHMDKYIDPYRRLFPNAPILVLRSEAGDWLLPWKKPNMDAAADVVCSVFPEIGAAEKTEANGVANAAPSSTPELVIHLWSNGGSASLARLRQSLAKMNASLPRFTLVLDSTPGQFSYSATYSAFSLVAPPRWRWLFRPLLHAFVAWFWVLTYVRSRFDFKRRAEVGERKLVGPLALLAASHNAKALLAAEARRTYIYSREDALIPYTDVEAHAEDAQKKGFTVRAEEFVGTQHVAHARKEPERYWEVVRETWEGGPFETSAEANGAEHEGNGEAKEVVEAAEQPTA